MRLAAAIVGLLGGKQGSEAVPALQNEHNGGEQQREQSTSVHGLKLAARPGRCQVALQSPERNRSADRADLFAN